MTQNNSSDPRSRREFLEKLSYVAPAILSIQARPAFAQRGSGGNAGDTGRDITGVRTPVDPWRRWLYGGGPLPGSGR
jgi:hypothetical protein